jgi:transposase InsO family protein
MRFSIATAWSSAAAGRATARAARRYPRAPRPMNLSKLSVWWLRLGIAIERIKPGHPQQNGRHERMHLTLKREATRPPGTNSLQQQDRFDAFVPEFNAERPHEALGMKCPPNSMSRHRAVMTACLT